MNNNIDYLRHFYVNFLFFIFYTFFFVVDLSAYQNRFPNRNDQNHKHKYDYNTLLTIAKSGAFQAVIAVSPDASPTAQYAAVELKRFLEKAVGAQINIKGLIQEGKLNFLIGGGSLLKKHGINADMPAVRDAFLIRHFKTGKTDFIVVMGKDDTDIGPQITMSQGAWENYYERATIFGVYDFLERFCNAGFFFPGDAGMVIPKQKDIIVPAMSIYEAPDFISRSINYAAPSLSAPDNISIIPGGYPHTSVEYRTWCNSERLFYRYETVFIPRAHGLSRMFLIERFGNTHPEFFSLLPDGSRDTDPTKKHAGHLCLTSKGLENEVKADIISYLQGDPPGKRNIPLWSPVTFQPGYVNVMVQDAFGERVFCRCNGCRPFYNKEEKYSDYCFSFVARVAESVKKIVPEAMITTMAYSTYTDIPKIALPDNIIVMLALMGPWEEKFPEQQKKNDSLIIEWNNKLGGRKNITLWTYINDYNGGIPLGIPPLSLRSISSFFKRNAPYILGAFQENEIKYKLHQYLNSYIFFKIAWDNNADTEKLIADHHALMFGSARQEMGEVFTLLEQKWTNEGINKIIKTVAGPSIVPKNQDIIWNKSYSDTFMKEITVLLQKAEMKAAGDEEVIQRIEYFKTHFFDPFFKSRKDFLSLKGEIQDLQYNAPFVSDYEMYIDGYNDEQAWSNSMRYGLRPLLKESKPKVLSDVQFLYSRKNLYITINCGDEKVNKMKYSRRKDNDPLIWQDSSLEIFINPSGDRRNYFQIIINPANSRTEFHYSEPSQKESIWKSSSKSRTQIHDEGWSAEISIPFKAIDFAPEKNQFMVINITRSRYLKDSAEDTELQSLSPFLRGKFHDPENFGSLRLLDEAGMQLTNIGYLINGSFEILTNINKPYAWEIMKGHDSDEVEVLFSDFMHGRTCIKLSSKNNSDGKRLILQHLLAKPLKPNTTYRITFFVKTKGIEVDSSVRYSGAWANINGTSGNIFIPGIMSWYKGDNNWTKESFVFKSGATKPVNYIRVGMTSAKGTAYFDDIRLEEVVAK